MADGLVALGLDVGPWLNDAKSAVRRGEPDHYLIEAGQGTVITLGELREHALHVAEGQRIAYVTDAAFHPDNAQKIVQIAHEADHLYIEAAFLDQDAGEAAARFHLTARQAGQMACMAGAKRVTAFHHSPRYLDRAETLRCELENALKL